MLHNMLLRLALVFMLISLGLTGCGPASQTTRQDPQALVEREQQALELMESRDYTAAADEYLRLAEQDQNNRSLYQLKAAGALYEGKDLNQAEQLLQDIQIKQDNELQLLQRRLLLARIALSGQQPDKALKHLSVLPASNTSKSFLATYHGIKAEAYEQKHSVIEAIHERLALSGLLGPGDEAQTNHLALWQLFTELEPEKLNELRMTGTRAMVSWTELAIIYKTMLGNQRNFAAAVEDWSVNHPGHPALSFIVPQLLTASAELNVRPTHIAVLLPMGGQFRQASRAIREGFVAAWHDDKSDRPRITFYNSDAMNINQAYQQAVEAGADFIVGPLEKTAINNLVEQGNPSLRTLALNYYDGQFNQATTEQVKPGLKFFQFGLAPENEAEQVAERAYFDGHLRALVVAPATPWGNRIYDAFKVRWEQLGGKLLERAVYSTETEDFSEPIKGLLNTDSSKLRAKNLQTTLYRKIYSEERRRQDADFIFIASNPVIARQLLPHIRFQRAGDLPVYSTSHVFAGQVNKERDGDLNDIIFADIPWVLDPNPKQSHIQSLINQYWAQASTSYKRLYALGYDAYALLPQLTNLSTQTSARYHGATGELYLNQLGQIQRYLTWARFVDGEPRLLNEMPVAQ